MRFGVLPGTAQLYLVSICALAVLLAVLAAFLPAAQAPLELFAVLGLAAAVAHSFPVSTPGKQAHHVSLPFLVAAIILLAPVQLVALVGVAHVAEWLRCRRSATAQVFNAAALTITSLVAQAAYRALGPVQGNPGADIGEPAFLAAVLVAVMLFVLLNRCLVGLAIWVGHRIAPPQGALFESDGLLTDGILLLMGVPLAHLAVIAPWAAAISAAPLWLIYRVLDLPNLRSQSRQDRPTELFNAPYLNETCTHELNRARRFGRPLTLLLLDLDGLAELNAAHGSQAGDAALRSVARTISRSIREYDLPARVARGLFGVLLPETDLAQAQDVAERVRREVAKQAHELPNSLDQIRLTLSIGGTVFSGGDAGAARLVDTARVALARAKQAGGDAIELVALPSSLADSDSHRVRPTPADAGSLAAGSAEVRASRLAPGQTGSPESRRVWWGTRLVLGGLAMAGLVVGVVWFTPPGDWRLLVALTSVAALAGLAFYFKSLPVALVLAIELHRSPARLWLAHSGRLWPLYLAVGATGLLVAYSYSRFGLAGAIALAAAALLFRQLAGRYVDRSLNSVRTLRTANAQLETLAFHDPLTRLANRTLFAERLEHAMLRSGDASVAVLFLDLDNFKTVNDTLGHGAGDALLLAATGRFKDCVRREDTIARLGGDEFTVLLENMHDPSDAARMAERISDALRIPFDLAGQQVVVSASIGIALDTDRSHTPDDLLRQADMAMYRAKSGGKARYAIFDMGLGTRAMERLELEAELRHAVERDQLVVHYQPIVDLHTGSVEALEAVVRWQHPVRGLLEPREFMMVAEQTGIILDIGQSVLYEACREAVAWQSKRPGLVVHVNLSPLELQRSALVPLVGEALTSAGLAPRCLRLEVPESAVPRDGHAGSGVLDDLRRVGVRIALDDVGEGTSSLAWLSRSPVDMLKISGSATHAPALVRAGVALAAALGMSVTAQGVDEADQAVELRELGCRYGQGGLYGGPHSAANVAAHLLGARDIPRAA